MNETIAHLIFVPLTIIAVVAGVSIGVIIAGVIIHFLDYLLAVIL